MLLGENSKENINSFKIQKIILGIAYKRKVSHTIIIDDYEILV